MAVNATCAGHEFTGLAANKKAGNLAVAGLGVGGGQI
jgi:hypothetical protein